MNRKFRIIIHALLAILFVSGGLLVMAKLTASKPRIAKKAPAQPVPIVRTLTVTTGTRPVIIRAEGTVQPLQEIQLVPQVGGEVIEVSPELVNGGRFRAGELLIRIDSTDYELAITLAQAAVKRAESELSLMQQEAASAREEWRKFFSKQANQKAPSALALKKPQLAAARAQWEAARADLDKAKLNLERTVIRAPFDGRVADKRVDTGQVVSPGQVLATIFSTEAAQIVIPLDNRDLAWFRVPGFTTAGDDGSQVLVKANLAGQIKQWTGRVVRSEGKIDQRTRMIPVVVRVDQPYASRPPLAVGLFVSVEIEGETLTDVAVVPRSLVHDDHQVWILDQQRKIRFQPVTVARFSGNHAWISSGLANGDRLVATALKTVTDGMEVRTLDDSGREDRS